VEWRGGEGDRREEKGMVKEKGGERKRGYPEGQRSATFLFFAV